MTDKLVSIITPSYNGARFIHRLLDSVVKQDYPSIEMIVVDDGSTDDTKDVIDRYIPEFAKRGYSLTYIFQENAGQSAAVNRALKLIKGSYLVWPDSDDFYDSPDAISKMAMALYKSDESVGMVRCLPVFLNEKDLKLHSKIIKDKAIYKSNLFEDCLYAHKFYWFVPGDYMAKVSALDECIKDREIYVEKNAGQNWQLMLPLLYKYKCLTIDEYLYNVVVRGQSHSRGHFKTFSEMGIKLHTYENTIIQTLNRMWYIPLEEKNDYITNINKKYLLERLNVCLIYHKRREAKSIISCLKNKYHFDLPLNRKVDYLFCQIPFYYLLKEKAFLLKSYIYDSNKR